MVTRLANRYIEEYQKGGPRRAGEYADKMFKDKELKKLVNTRVKELATVVTRDK